MYSDVCMQNFSGNRYFCIFGFSGDIFLEQMWLLLAPGHGTCCVWWYPDLNNQRGTYGTLEHSTAFHFHGEDWWHTLL